MLINPAPFVNDYERALKPAMVRWVMPGWEVGGMENTVIVAGDIYYIPIFVPERTAYDRIAIYIFAGDGLGGLCELRLYNWAGGLPTTQVLAPGTVPTNLAGAQEIVIALTLERGYYFTALRGDQAPTLRGITPTGVGKCPSPGFIVTNDGNGQRYVGETVTGALADPALAPTGGISSDYAFVALREA